MELAVLFRHQISSSSSTSMRFVTFASAVNQSFSSFVTRTPSSLVRYVFFAGHLLGSELVLGLFKRAHLLFDCKPKRQPPSIGNCLCIVRG